MHLGSRKAASNAALDLTIAASDSLSKDLRSDGQRVRTADRWAAAPGLLFTLLKGQESARRVIQVGPGEVVGLVRGQRLRKTGRKRRIVVHPRAACSETRPGHPRATDDDEPAHTAARKNGVLLDIPEMAGSSPLAVREEGP